MTVVTSTSSRSKRNRIRAPFPYFGGKYRAAPLIWPRIGTVRNLIIPFFGSGGELWGGVDMLFDEANESPIITVNDKDCMVANFWRAIQKEPDTVAEFADWPVNEADLHARHKWLVLSEDATEFRRRMKADPDYHDARIAGWWAWGLCCWIGGGWCSNNPKMCTPETEGRPHLGADGGNQGLNREPKQCAPDISGHSLGRGVNRRRPKLSSNGVGTGVHRSAALETHEWQQRPDLSDGAGRGIHAKRPTLSDGHGGPGQKGLNGRPQLADQFSRGRGVHGNDSAETCTNRREWLIDWFRQLQDKLRTVRVCCGDWKRVCGSRSVTTRIGVTGVMLDPPYGEQADRDPNLYAEESLEVAEECRIWSLANGDDPMMRIALCGLEGEHNELESRGWSKVAWKAHGGYGNRNPENNNRDRERIWFSPHCDQPGDGEQFLFEMEGVQ